jgi:hypothetical protein
MRELFVRQRHGRFLGQRYCATIFAGCLILSLGTVAGCTTRIDSVAETAAAPSTLASPTPIAGSLPAAPEQQVWPDQTTTEQPPVIVGVNENVQRAIRNATDVVGIETTYLMVVAARESSFDPRKRARRTTATGLYQFTADTWLRAIRAFGERHGLAEYARQIVVDQRGAPSMRNAAARTRLLRLRADPKLSALMAAELARDNEMRLEHILGRPVTPAEIYIAHLLGVTQAARVIETARSAPQTPGVRLAPAAAQANPDLFKPLGRVASANSIVSKIKVHYQRQELRFAQHVGMNGDARSSPNTSMATSPSGWRTSDVGASFASAPASAASQITARDG